MKSITLALFATVVVVTSVCACQGEPAEAARSVVGRLLLPPGEGSRGVEVVLTIAGLENRTWVLFDEQGRFEHELAGSLERVIVSTGLSAELHRIEAAELPEPDRAGRIDLGAIDLRDALMTHRLILRAADGAAPGDVRIALCFGPPPVGPNGESVALGSRQFPPIALGSAVDWLLPHDAEDVHFLVERPDGSTDDGEWRSGRQRLFGPFTSRSLPSELEMD